jgi:hypothetical protein
MRTEPRKGVPKTLRWAVLSGMITVSSWSLPSRFWPLLPSTPTTTKGLLLDAHGLADRVFVAEQVLRRGLAEQRDARRRRTSESPKAAPLAMSMPGARRGIPALCRRRWRSSFAAVDQLATCPGGSAPRDDAVEFGDRLAVGHRQRRPAGRRCAHRPLVGAGEDDEQVGAHGADRLLDGELRALADGHHEHHGADADHHAEHGQAVRILRLAPMASQASPSTLGCDHAAPRGVGS